MRPNNTLSLIFLFVIIPALNMIAQDNQDEMFYIAEGYIESENFGNSISLYERVLDEDPDNPKVNFKLGFCYLNTPDQKDKAIKYIEKSVKYFEKKKKRMRKNKTEYLESCFYLAKALQASGKYDIAIDKYKNLKTKISNKKLIDVIDKEIMNTSKSKALLKDSVLPKITNLGAIINSEYSDNSAVVSADESVLLFTSRRKNKYNETHGYDGEYDENIYICYRNDDGSWTAPQSISDSINTADHEGLIGISADGQQLLMYKSDDGGSIYMSTLKGDIWSKPKKLGSNINTRNRETHASISADGSTLYFTSDRVGGFGGLDIYYSQKQEDGTWGEAINMGEAVNTKEDERAPYIHADGKTLYFSSKGHSGIGGFDIFVSKKTEFDTWTKPESLDYPINTPLDDVYYIGTADGKRSYYSSSRKGGLGKTDIYVIDLEDAAFEPEIIIMKGKVSICRGKLPEVSILVKEKKNNKVFGIYVPNTKTGKFLFVLNRGNEYLVEFYTDSGMFYNETLVIGDSLEYKQFHEEVKIPVNPPCEEEIEEKSVANKVEKFEIHNMLFSSTQKRISGENKDLDKLAKYLVENPKAVIEIGGYADAKGKASLNYNLALRRAVSVREYLFRHDVMPKQVKVVAYGEENPIALNKNKNGTWNKEGQRYNRRIEFKIIKQGEIPIVVKHIDNIPADLLNKKYDKNYKKNRRRHLEINY